MYLWYMNLGKGFIPVQREGRGYRVNRDVMTRSFSSVILYISWPGEVGIYRHSSCTIANINPRYLSSVRPLVETRNPGATPLQTIFCTSSMLPTPTSK